MGKFLQCTMSVNSVNALLKVRLVLYNFGVSLSLVLVGTRDVRSRSRIATTPLPRVTSPLLLIFLFFDDAGETVSPSISAPLSCVSSAASSVSSASRFGLARMKC